MFIPPRLSYSLIEFHSKRALLWRFNVACSNKTRSETSCKVPGIFCARFYRNLQFFGRFSRNFSISNLKEIQRKPRWYVRTAGGAWRRITGAFRDYAKTPRNDGRHKTSLRSKNWSDQLFNIPARKYHRQAGQNNSPELHRAANFSDCPDKHSNGTALTCRPRSARGTHSVLLNNHARLGKLFTYGNSMTLSTWQNRIIFGKTSSTWKAGSGVQAENFRFLNRGTRGSLIDTGPQHPFRLRLPCTMRPMGVQNRWQGELETRRAMYS